MLLPLICSDISITNINKINSNMRKLLLFFAMLCVSVGTQAAITITAANNIYVGGTAYNGYGIYGAKAGEIAQLLNDTYSGTVNWNGASLSALQSAELIKVGSTSAPNVLNDDDLEALELLSGARFLDIDGSQLAAGANISSIKAGPNIEAVTLPNQLTKKQVNAAGASLKACNTNFGSCMSLDAEMEEKEVTTYTYTDLCTSEEVDYTGTVTDGKGHIDNITRELTLTGSSFTFVNSKFRDVVTPCSESEVVDGKVVPSQLKVELTVKNLYSYNGTTYDPSDGNVSWWLNEDGTVKSQYGPTGLPVDTQLEAVPTYTYKWRDNYENEGTYTYNGTPQYDETYGCYYAMIDNTYTAQAGYQFDVTSGYDYTYTDLDCNEQTYHSATPQETIDLAYNQDVDLESTTQTVNVPKEGGNTTVVAYVKTPGTLYQATSLDNYDVEVADTLIISGNINNADISVHEGAGDPNATQNDDDAFTSTGAIPAFYVNNKQATIKSVDMSDAVIDDYKHLRVLNAYGANLESVVFPKKVTRIPNYCCYSSGGNGCQNLSNVVFPTEAASFEIGDYAFQHTALASLLIPSSVTYIGDHAFALCDQITDVEMEALKNGCDFGNYVFANCSALKHVTLSEKVKNIGDYQFNQCGLLESIRIPSTCKTIGENAFYECFSIHEITIPEGVELIKVNAFELSGLTDIYVMATSPDKVPKIYAQDLSIGTNGGPSTFSNQRTTGYNTVPNKSAEAWSNADYDEVMSWYQEEQSGDKGLGTGRSLLALHYPESMKPFYEAIDITKVYTTEQLAQFTANGLVNYFTPDQYLNFIQDATLKAQVQGDITNRIVSGGVVTNTEATRLVDPETHQELDLLYLPQTYAIDPYQNGSNPLQGPDKDNRYYPAQSDMVVRMAAGATGVNSGGTDNVASQWGWRQFPLSSSIESIGETPFEKEYDDTWYTMCFPWKMVDNQLFMAFNQKCEIVEFIGAEVLQDPENEYNYNLVFHFDEVAKTYYMDDAGVEYNRERDGDRVDAAGHKLYVYTSKVDETVVRCPEEVTNGSYNPQSASATVKEAYGKYLSIQNIMVLPGHPYMIHPSIGAAPGNPAKVYINGVKKISVGGVGEPATLAAVAESQKVERTVTSNKKGETSATAWTNPVTGAGGKYTFIGNINDAKDTDVEGREGAQDMPTENGPVYFLGLKPGTDYPQFFKKPKGKGQGMWSQYSAIIVPDADAIANVEGLDGMSVGSGSGSGAKGFDVVFGEWEIVDEDQMATVIDNAVAEGEEKNEPAKIQRLNVVYNIKGQVVRSNSSSVEGLPKGLYIVNGKKYLVK